MWLLCNNYTKILNEINVNALILKVFSIHIYIHTYINIYEYINIYVYIYVCIYIYI